ncbi:CYTH domain-containing protein [Pedobacter alluvionis]|uniref:Adenylate cyclase n=1 Tax=Pedobacter alluvionis TaxID=475253 RepID=A0A497XUJ6_9SPHI|nr:CYTH domain-containing protein [Pedobacter alluvionis]RLJ72060.1 adenylate cyclase [Pedobacter alluvionis]TFB28832.1 CYTH domain-containing protein [Pedobacter alluvionis]
MGKEIERKFLIDHHKWDNLNKPEGKLFRQGYLLTDKDKTIRVRATKTKGFLTIKGQTIGATRLEYEYEIPVTEATELLDNFAVSELSKTRYEIKFNDKLWEVDVFSGDNLGLIVAEIELESEEENFDLPDWIGKEVTEEEKYYNSNLTVKPFKDWV